MKKNILNKSKQRTIDFGEVNTNEKIVKKMLDLVKPELNRIDSRFLEPACGDGNFLSEIFVKKLKSSYVNFIFMSLIGSIIIFKFLI